MYTTTVHACESHVLISCGDPPGFCFFTIGNNCLCRFEHIASRHVGTCIDPDVRAKQVSLLEISLYATTRDTPQHGLVRLFGVT